MITPEATHSPTADGFMRPWHAIRLLLPAISLAGAGCDSSDTTDPGNAPRYVGAVSTANPNNAISGIVTVTATGYDSVYVRFWRDSAPAERSPSIAFGTDSVVTFPVLGLDTSATYAFEINLERKGKAVVPADTLSHSTGVLPAWIPVIGVSGTDTSAGFLLLSLPNGPVIINNAGRVLWYRERIGGVLGSWTAQPNGEHTWLATTDSSGYYVYNVLGEETGRYSCQGYKTRFHDVLVTATGDVWIMCDEVATVDLTSFGGVDSAQVTATVVQHLDPSGQLQFQWRSLDHFQFTDVDPSILTGAAVNFTHSNAIELDGDGNLLLSSRSLDEITKIDVTTGAILWRFGGLANQFTILGDPKGAFQRQHGLRSLGTNHLQFLDNGTTVPSRLVRYSLDTLGMTATLDWQFIDSPTTFAGVGGATQAYPDGGALVTFGPAGRVVEVDANGARRWELTGINGTYVFRAQRLASLYSPGAGPYHR